MNQQIILTHCALPQCKYIQLGNTYANVWRCDNPGFFFSSVKNFLTKKNFLTTQDMSNFVQNFFLSLVFQKMVDTNFVHFKQIGGNQKFVKILKRHSDGMVDSYGYVTLTYRLTICIMYIVK